MQAQRAEAPASKRVKVDSKAQVPETLWDAQMESLYQEIHRLAEEKVWSCCPLLYLQAPLPLRHTVQTICGVLILQATLVSPAAFRFAADHSQALVVLRAVLGAGTGGIGTAGL